MVVFFTNSERFATRFLWCVFARILRRRSRIFPEHGVRIRVFSCTTRNAERNYYVTVNAIGVRRRRTLFRRLGEWRRIRNALVWRVRVCGARDPRAGYIVIAYANVRSIKLNYTRLVSRVHRVKSGGGAWSISEKVRKNDDSVVSIYVANTWYVN